MRYKVPHDLKKQDKIIGPLSLKGLIILSIGLSIDYSIFLGISKIIGPTLSLIPVSIIAAIVIFIVFYKYNNLEFVPFILLVIENFINPRTRYWIKMSDSLSPFEKIDAITKKTTEKKDNIEEEQLEKYKKIQNLINTKYK